jgi:two-component system response regulator AtoC
MPEQKHIRALLAVANPSASSALRAFLHARSERMDVRACDGSHAASLVEEIASSRPHVLFLEVNGHLKSLTAVGREFEHLPVVVVAAPSPSVAFRAAKLGAAEILTLPLDERELPGQLEEMLGSLTTADANGHGANGSGNAMPDFPQLFSSSPRMADIRNTIEKVATTSATVLIRGESGVGKEVVARMIFGRSERRDKPFVKVNCAAIPADLLESELFGYEAGAFTGAQRAKPGKFELADGGTLFLDEIGEMHPVLQAKLLHVLQDGEFARLGAKHDIAVDVRVLCATNKLLEQRVAEGHFREDLFYRINVVTVHIPPLRERRDEIPRLLHYFLQKYAVVYARPVAPLGDEVMKFLTAYSWPGNIRELENLCKRYVIVGGATQIVRELAAHAGEKQWQAGGAASASAATPSQGEVPSPAEEPSLLEIGRRAAWLAERNAIQEMLAETRWNRREAARRLRVSYKALLNKIRQIEDENLAQHGHHEA